MRKNTTRKRPYFKMESAMTAILRDASGKMHHGILFGPPLGQTIRKLMGGGRAKYKKNIRAREN